MNNQFADSLMNIAATALPHQRAILRVLAVAKEHQLDPAPMLKSLASELSFFDRRSLNRALQRSARSNQLIGELDQEIRFFPAGLGYGLRVASKQDQLAAIYQELRRRGVIFAKSDPLSNSNFKLFGTFLKTIAILVISLVIITKVIPELLMILEEFQLDNGIVIQVTAWIFDRFSSMNIGFYLTAFALTLVLAIGCFVLVCRLFIRWLPRLAPLRWKSRSVSQSVARRQILSLMVESENDLGIQFGSFTDGSSARALFPKFERISRQIAAGHSPWQVLQDQRILSNGEAQALAQSGPPTQAWLLRWFATDRDCRRLIRFRFGIGAVLLIINILLVLIVLLFSVLIFGSVIEILDVLIEQ